MAWWWWVLAGLALLGIEAVTPGGFVALFFGLAAIAVGVVAAAGVPMPVWLEWLLFSVGSVVALLVFRNPLLRALQAGSRGHAKADVVGEVATLLDDVAAGAVGRGELRGTTWTVRNDDARTLARGERARVVRIDGLTLWLRGERAEGGRG